jgi:hypothetical protein
MVLNSSIDVDDMSERFTHKYIEMMRKRIHELVDSIAKTDSKAYWSLIKNLRREAIITILCHTFLIIT